MSLCVPSSIYTHCVHTYIGAYSLLCVLKITVIDFSQCVVCDGQMSTNLCNSNAIRACLCQIYNIRLKLNSKIHVLILSIQSRTGSIIQYITAKLILDYSLENHLCDHGFHSRTSTSVYWAEVTGY